MPDQDPNTWPEGQKQVLRMVHQHGGWYTAWPEAPPRGAAQAVQRRTGITWQRDHHRGEGAFTEPHTARDRRILADLYDRLETP